MISSPVLGSSSGYRSRTSVPLWSCRHVTVQQSGTRQLKQTLSMMVPQATKRTTPEAEPAAPKIDKDNLPDLEDSQMLGFASLLTTEAERTEKGIDFSEKALEDIISDQKFSPDPPGHKSGFVAIIGFPNAGKSTLLNTLVGRKLAIVSAKAQSTRNKVLGILSEPDHQAILVDTPGVIAEKRNPLEGRMMSYVKSSMKQADAIVAIVDVSKTDRQDGVLAMLQPPPTGAPPMLVALNKVDKVTAKEAAKWKAWWEERCRCEKVVCMSALKSIDAKQVSDWMVEKLPEGPSLYPKDQLAEYPEKFFVAEIVREKVFEQYQQEIPYAMQVNVLEFIERSKGKDYIHCELVVERDQQKGIVIGARGSAINAVSTAARRDIEQFLERPVYLEMTVRVDKNWRADSEKLKAFGY